MGKKVEFYHEDIGSSKAMGTKYNFVVSGESLGVFNVDGKMYLATRVEESFGNNCMRGTIDVREVACKFSPDGGVDFYSNNDVSNESMFFSRMLSTEAGQDYINSGGALESYSPFVRAGLNIKPSDVQITGETTCVAGISTERFEQLKSATVSDAYNCGTYNRR